MRIPVELRRAYRLLNHGPTTLVTAAHAGRRNVMAAAWVMPVDFDPPKLAAVIATGTFTRELVDASGEFAIQVPSAAQLELTYAVGSRTGSDGDKFDLLRIPVTPASTIAAPLVEGCLAWLECRVLPEPKIAEDYDLFVAEILAAWADDTAWDGRDWIDPSTDDRRAIHHVAGGQFFLQGGRVSAKPPR